MSDPFLKITAELVLVRDVLAADRGDTYEIPAISAVVDLDAAINALLVFAPTARAVPTRRPPLLLLIGRLRVARASLERTVLLSGGPVDAFVAGSALRPLGSAIALLAMSAAACEDRAVDPRAAELQAIGDQLQAVLDQLDAMHDRAIGTTLIGVHVSEAIDRLRTEVGLPPTNWQDLDARLADAAA